MKEGNRSGRNPVNVILPCQGNPRSPSWRRGKKKSKCYQPHERGDKVWGCRMVGNCQVRGIAERTEPQEEKPQVGR